MLGESYLLIDAERNPQDFKAMLGICDPADVYGFISYNSGSKEIPLYKKSTYFIMVGNGQTFENVTWNGN